MTYFILAATGFWQTFANISRVA